MLAANAVGVRTRGPLAGRNPVAKLGAAFLPAVVLLASVDPVSSGLILATAVLSVPAWGLRWRDVARRGWPLALAVGTIAIGNAVFTGRKGGTVLVDAGPLLLTSESVVAGGTAGMRLAAIAVPGVLAVLTIDPVDLADSLAAHLRVSPRFAYGSLAALRLAPLLATEWEILGRARRARGLQAGGNPVAAVRLFGGRLFALLVGAVRRGSQLAAAMDARGFDSRGPRTCARSTHFTRADTTLLLGSGVLTATAVVLAVATGQWSAVL
ncbi:energy-coupling factor transporter transmembrane component T family protein [Phytoactinopolyspora halotolerans]|uniref:Energy-coupling factor transporter transmembrane protein EcfT n=1 Tax=Phytoactinopolyspora halotolerans TaxID=1981512 RepID=A0A6L9SG58_9ACTN|nr:energy-coupling factor transporter transmembrane component T [Phytoactinopolyspora halotolerans]NEE04109.1 energy-coupling factor transporter transmembrane protein EcfT [Phytoactinopolyspora halotolerans]